MDEINYLSKEKQAELAAELEYLKVTKRREVAESLEYAKGLGDLSENAEYHEARENQAKIEDRIMKLESILKTAIVVTGNHSGNVEFGSKVTIQKEGEKDSREFMIVGSEEADMANGKLSNHSPLGSALMGNKKGDTVKVQTPKGPVAYKIISVK